MKLCDETGAIEGGQKVEEVGRELGKLCDGDTQMRRSIKRKWNCRKGKRYRKLLVSAKDAWR